MSKKNQNTHFKYKSHHKFRRDDVFIQPKTNQLTFQVLDIISFIKRIESMKAVPDKSHIFFTRLKLFGQIIEGTTKKLLIEETTEETTKTKKNICNFKTSTTIKPKDNSRMP